MLTRLRLAQFRCFTSIDRELEPGSHLLVGANARGKTSFLEALCLVLRLQSPRTNTLRDLVKFDSTGFSVDGTTDTGTELRIVVENNRRKLMANGDTVDSAWYLKQSGLVVWLGNDDREIVSGSAKHRRRYLDFVGSQIVPGYRRHRHAYDRALRMRNALLKRCDLQLPKEFDACTRVLVDHGVALTQLRFDLVEKLAGPVVRAGQRIGTDLETILLEYKPKTEGLLETFMQVLEDKRADEIRRGRTLAGPHLDDMVIEINHKPAGPYGSEGQQRTIAIALKLAQMDLLCANGPEPVILIDDVFGELDAGRRQRLLAALPQAAQKFITTTEPNWLPLCDWQPDFTHQTEDFL